MKYKILNALKGILYLILVIIIITMIYFIFNYKIYIVTSGSMQPTLQINEMVITKNKTNNTNYQQGDIITYYNSEENIYITHRIVEVLDDGYFTKGDYNNINDLEIVTEEQITGKVVYHSLFLGNLFVKYKLILLSLFITFIILCYILLFLKNTRKKESCI